MNKKINVLPNQQSGQYYSMSNYANNNKYTYMWYMNDF